MKNLMDYELIAKYLSGECSADENERLRQFREESPENEAEFLAVASLWTLSAGEAEAAGREQAARAWEKSRRGRGVIGPWMRGIAAAAAVVLVASVAWMAGRSGGRGIPSDIVVKTAAGQHSEVVLPDGSQVFLNSSSSLSYSSDFSAENRHLRLLEGEAVFQIAKDSGHPFVVEGVQLDIRVYGTTFDVRAYGAESQFEVSLQEGSIEVLDKAGASLCRMAPGESYIYDKATESGQLSAGDVSMKGVWRLPELKIRNCTLAETVALMSEWYGMEFNVEGKLSDSEKYWMTIKTESVREMLSLMAKITPMSYDIVDNKVTIKLL